MKSAQIVALAASTLSSVSAHSHVTNFVINGDSYAGFNTKIPEGDNPEVLAAWGTSVGPSDGWIGVKEYNKPDIVCHINATNAQGYAPVDAGDKIHFQWMGWPESHKGPSVTYLARCGEGSDGAAKCAEVDKTELEFFQIGAAGLMDPNGVPNENPTAKGLWASDMLIANNNSWVAEIPSKVKPGFYVLRHELIALHYANNITMGGPQHYPQCVTLQIRGQGTELPQGVKAMGMYKQDDAGLTYNIFQEKLPTYPIPGPKLMDGVPGLVEQTPSEAVGDVPALPARPSTRG